MNLLSFTWLICLIIFFPKFFEYLQNMHFELDLTFYLRLQNFQALCSANFGLDWLELVLGFPGSSWLNIDQ